MPPRCLPPSLPRYFPLLGSPCPLFSMVRACNGGVMVGVRKVGCIGPALSVLPCPPSLNRSACSRHFPTCPAVVQWQGFSSLDQSLPPVTAQQIATQMAVLNADYSGTGLQFAAPTVRRHEHQNWTADCWNSLAAILAAVNTAPQAAVNVLVCDLASSAGILGCVRVGVLRLLLLHEAVGAAAAAAGCQPASQESTTSIPRLLDYDSRDDSNPVAHPFLNPPIHLCQQHHTGHAQWL